MSLTTLLDLIDKATLDKANELRYCAEIEEHELLQVAYAVAAQRHGLPPPSLKLEPLPSGAIPLYSRGFFPWKGLPYPHEHARLGTLLAQLPHMKSMALGMIPFQEATLDHNLKPISSFFTQEGSPLWEEANNLFFHTLDHTPSRSGTFSDSTLGIVADKKVDSTTLLVASGCKSGMGAFLRHGGGVINFGPQLLPVSDCAGFGLAGRGEKVTLHRQGERLSLSFRNRLAAPSPRRSPLNLLYDSSFSGQWLEASLSSEGNNLLMECHLEGLHPINNLVFSFFIRSQTCSVARSHQLAPKSLHRYQGPPQPVTFDTVTLEGQGLHQMEIIPLAGNSSYWGADYLVVFTPSQKSFSFKLRGLNSFY